MRKQIKMNAKNECENEIKHSKMNTKMNAKMKNLTNQNSINPKIQDNTESNGHPPSPPRL